jgi:hypothetical protein
MVLAAGVGSQERKSGTARATSPGSCWGAGAAFKEKVSGTGPETPQMSFGVQWPIDPAADKDERTRHENEQQQSHQRPADHTISPGQDQPVIVNRTIGEY